ncbi:MAG: thioredoxin [Armatimonadetes bacterium]|nr:thioredoxin [Armatimonadota bacterium]MDI9583648.1 CD1871A family CXXC motif-containing protein [Acidobacteriota bacterium]
MRRYVWVGLVALAVVMMAIGLGRGEWADVLQQANTLCTACIGLTEGQ